MVNGSSAETEAHSAEFTGAVWSRFQPGGRRQKVLKHFLLVDCFEKRCSFLLIARVSANRRETIRSKDQEIRYAQTPSHIFDIRVQATILMYQQHSRELYTGVCRTDEIPADASGPLWRRYAHISGLEPLVVLGDLLRQSVIWPETFPDGHRRQTTHRVLLCGIEEGTATDLAVNVTIKYVQ